MVSRGWGEGEGGEQLLNGYEFLWGGVKVFCNYIEVGVHNIVHVLNAPELFTLRWFTFCV